MWIGRVPFELQRLALPKSLLVSQLFPRVYVYKLYPKGLHSGIETEGLQRGLRGSVTTFELDMKGIASMVEGNLMLQPLQILPSTISVTYAGHGHLPKNWLRNTFRVRRRCVADALTWLKEHNPKYYGNIDISMERLATLPDDDIPEELTGIVRQTEETDVIVRESEGYVNNDDIERSHMDVEGE